MSKAVKAISNDDLEHVLLNTTLLWDDLANKTILITGGTGFFGKWLLESFIYISNKLSPNTTLYVLSRNYQSFLSAYPKFNHPAIKFINGDIRSFEFPDVPLHYIIHAATEASVSLNVEQPILMYDTIVDGTKHVLELARNKNVTAVLHTSSGAVYGSQPSDITHIGEDINSSPNIYDKGAAYGEGKRVAEMMCAMYYQNYGVKSKIARCFAFLGPYLPLDAHFAVGNFIANTIKATPIQINGDGTPYRSYLYASDLVIWLWTILLNGEACRPYNVGSDDDITIAALANKVIAVSNTNLAISIMKKPDHNIPAQRYVPSIDRAKNELNLKVLIDLETAIKKTIAFNIA